jgi:glycosyltransferase involved in cell wall biosynthesis
VKIAVATDVASVGGVDNYVMALLDALQRHGHEVVLLFERTSTSRVVSAAAARRVAAFPLPLHRLRHPREVAENACLSLLKESRPDGIHIVGGSPRSCLALRSAARGLGIALIITEQQVDQQIRLSSEHRAEIRASYADAIAVVFVSSGNRDTIVKAVGLEGVRSLVINNAVDLERMGKYRKAILRPRIPARIITVARLSPEKSLNTLISAVSLLPDGLVGELNIYGEGPARPELSEQISRLKLDGRVFLRGWTADALPLLLEHDIFILPSISEGMPYSLLEAMAVGLPAICTDVPGMVEALAEGRAGRIVPKCDAGALAAGITQCLNEPTMTEQKAKIAMSRVHSHYGQAAIMDQTVRLWEEAGILRSQLARLLIVVSGRIDATACPDAIDGGAQVEPGQDAEGGVIG